VSPLANGGAVYSPEWTYAVVLLLPTYRHPRRHMGRHPHALDGSWRREVLPLCPRCDRLLREAGREGRVLKATGERWFGGHTIGRFQGMACSTRRMVRRLSLRMGAGTRAALSSKRTLRRTAPNPPSTWASTPLGCRKLDSAG
jgi:hypothetical protein